MELSKATPVAAGLGGGSSDAATTLLLLDRLWNVGLGDRELSDLGAEIGSDVPLFFHLPSAVIRGRGEIVEPIRLAWSGWIVLVFGGMEVSSREVYTAWTVEDRSRLDQEAAVKAVVQATTAEEIRPLLFNELEPAVFRVCPAVQRLWSEIHECGGKHARVSGAGSTVYTIHDDEEEARAFAETIRSRGFGAGVAVVRIPCGHAAST
jgi:4-diphosphocytidyl-2-C-methyl-D-erythritol kinase